MSNQENFEVFVSSLKLGQVDTNFNFYCILRTLIFSSIQQESANLTDEEHGRVASRDYREISPEILELFKNLEQSQLLPTAFISNLELSWFARLKTLKNEEEYASIQALIDKASATNEYFEDPMMWLRLVISFIVYQMFQQGYEKGKTVKFFALTTGIALSSLEASVRNITRFLEINPLEDTALDYLYLSVLAVLYPYNIKWFNLPKATENMSSREFGMFKRGQEGVLQWRQQLAQKYMQEIQKNRDDFQDIKHHYHPDFIAKYIDKIPPESELREIQDWEIFSLCIASKPLQYKLFIEFF